MVPPGTPENSRSEAPGKTPDSGEKVVEFELPVHVELIETRELKHGLSLSLRYFDVRCVLRERKRGTIECKASWISTSSQRVRTGHHDWSEAVEWAYHEMKEIHLRNIGGGSNEKPAATPGLRLTDAARVIREKGLIPGTENSKTWRAYDLVLDLALAVWTDDPPIDQLHKGHIRRMYDARALPEYLNKKNPPPFEWPPWVKDRKPLGRVTPQTVQKNLEDIRTLLGTLVGEVDPKNRRYLKGPPMAGLDLGEHESEKRDTAGPDRYRVVITHADAAVEKIRTIGHQYEERRRYKGEWQTYNRTDSFDLIVPGILRMMLVVQYGHPTRPKAIRHIRLTDVAVSRNELILLIRSLRSQDGDDVIPVEWAEYWPHGGVAYRREWSKNDTERVVPMSSDFLAELLRYLKKREAWLKKIGHEDSPWLFPSPRDPLKAISESDARTLLACGEEFARERLREEGVNPDLMVPEFHGTAWYAYRRYWKTNRNTMGWQGNQNAAYVGDWSTKIGPTPDVKYALLAPHLILGVVEGKTLTEATDAREEAVQQAKRGARLRPDVDDDEAGIPAS